MRPARREDLRELVRIEEELFYPANWPYDVLDTELHSQDRYYVVATASTVGPVGTNWREKIIGYAGVAFFDVAEIMTVGVRKDAQGQGIGRALVEELIANSESREYEQIFLEVRVDNTVAINLYRTLNFTDVRVRRGYYQPDNIDALVMRRK